MSIIAWQTLQVTIGCPFGLADWKGGGNSSGPIAGTVFTFVSFPSVNYYENNNNNNKEINIIENNGRAKWEEGKTKKWIRLAYDVRCLWAISDIVIFQERLSLALFSIPHFASFQIFAFSVIQLFSFLFNSSSNDAIYLFNETNTEARTNERRSNDYHRFPLGFVKQWEKKENFRDAKWLEKTSHSRWQLNFAHFPNRSHWATNKHCFSQSQCFFNFPEEKRRSLFTKNDTLAVRRWFFRGGFSFSLTNFIVWRIRLPTQVSRRFNWGRHSAASVLWRIARRSFPKTPLFLQPILFVLLENLFHYFCHQCIYQKLVWKKTFLWKFNIFLEICSYRPSITRQHFSDLLLHTPPRIHAHAE